MGEMLGWSVGETVNVWIDEPAHGPIPVPSEVVGIFDAQHLVEVRVGSDLIGLRGAAPVLCFPMLWIDIDQSGRCAFDITDAVGEPE